MAQQVENISVTPDHLATNKRDCGGCENSVKFVLSDLTGVEQVEADHRTQIVCSL